MKDLIFIRLAFGRIMSLAGRIVYMIHPCKIQRRRSRTCASRSFDFGYRSKPWSVRKERSDTQKNCRSIDVQLIKYEDLQQMPHLLSPIDRAAL